MAVLEGLYRLAVGLHPAGFDVYFRVVHWQASPQLTLVLGGARSGKSRYAEQLVMASPSPWIYVATAEPFDDEMKARIAEHRSRRGAAVADRRSAARSRRGIAGASAAATVLVDCLTLWLSNLMFKNRDIDAEIAAPRSSAGRAPGARGAGQQ